MLEVVKRARSPKTDPGPSSKGMEHKEPKTKLGANLNKIVMVMQSKHRHLKRIDKEKAEFQHSIKITNCCVTNKFNLLLILWSVCCRLGLGYTRFG